MKTLQKALIIIILAAIVVLFNFTSVQADGVEGQITAADPEAKILEYLGVLKGVGNGVDDVYRASTQNRYQVAWIFLRLLGKEEEAKAWTGTDNFKDTATAKNSSGQTLNAENKRMLAYLYSHKELGFRGYPDNTFKPFETLDYRMFYKLMLVACKYEEGIDFTWSNVFEKANEYDLTTKSLSNTEKFTIDRLSEITVKTLKAIIRGGSKTLITKLIEDDKVIDSNRAQQAGLFWRLYSQDLGPVYNKEDTLNVGPPESATYRLPEVYTGNVTINFDMVQTGDDTDSSVSFMTSPVLPLNHKDTDSHYYSHHSIMISMNYGIFKMINGGIFIEGPNVRKDVVYHIRIEANMNEHYYSVYLSQKGGTETLIGNKLAFRTRGAVLLDPANPYVKNAEDIAAVVVSGVPPESMYMKNLVIMDNTP